MTKPSQALVWMVGFLAGVAALAALLSVRLLQNFEANPFFNGVILAVLVFGVFVNLRQVLLLSREVEWIEAFKRSPPDRPLAVKPKLLVPMARMLAGRERGKFSLSAPSLRSILDSVYLRLEESRDLSRYLVGLAIFLGLLGTFWGLLQTVSSVGATIGALDTGTGENVMLFDQLKEGLAGPLKGMGTAFSCSMFGLAGSLILGFLDLQAGHAQGRFYNELEDWLSGITELQPADAASAAAMSPQLRFALIDMQRSLSDLSEKVELRVLNDNTGDAVKDLAQGVDKLIRQMRAEQKVVREWADEQAQQQQELAAVLRQITDQSGVPVREEQG